MTTPTQALSQKVTLINELGLHARSAAMIAKTAQKAHASVWIEKDGNRVDATSIMDLLTLACSKGTGITVVIKDPNDMPILDHIVRMVKEGFGE
jgi:phosphotransferase system HPr (HPr) family protein